MQHYLIGFFAAWSWFQWFRLLKSIYSHYDFAGGGYSFPVFLYVGDLN